MWFVGLEHGPGRCAARLGPVVAVHAPHCPPRVTLLGGRCEPAGRISFGGAHLSQSQNWLSGVASWWLSEAETPQRDTQRPCC